MILGQVLLCLSACLQCALLNWGMGRRKADLASLRAEAIMCAYIYWWFVLHVNNVKVHEPKAEKNSGLGVMWSPKPE